MKSEVSDLAVELAFAADRLRQLSSTYEARFTKESKASVWDQAGICIASKANQEITTSEEWWTVFLPLATCLLKPHSSHLPAAFLMSVGMQVVDSNGRSARHWVNFTWSESDAKNLNPVISYVSRRNQRYAFSKMQLLSEWYSSKRRDDSSLARAPWIEYSPLSNSVLYAAQSGPVRQPYGDIEVGIESRNPSLDAPSFSIKDVKDDWLLEYRENPSFVDFGDGTRSQGYAKWIAAIYEAVGCKQGRLLLVPSLHYLDYSWSEHRTASMIVYFNDESYEKLESIYGLVAAVFHCGSVLFQNLSKGLSVIDELEIFRRRNYGWNQVCPKNSMCSGPQHSIPLFPVQKRGRMSSCVMTCFGKYHFPFIMRLCGVLTDEVGDYDISSILSSEVPFIVHESLKSFSQGKVVFPMLDIITVAYSLRSRNIRDSAKEVISMISGIGRDYSLDMVQKNALEIKGVECSSLVYFCSLIETILNDPKYFGRTSLVETGFRMNEGVRRFHVRVDAGCIELAESLARNLRRPRLLYSTEVADSSLAVALGSFFIEWNSGSGGVGCGESLVSVSCSCSGSQVDIEFRCCRLKPGDMK